MTRWGKNDESLLAVDEDKRPREYLVMEARDVFHGPLPPPPAPPVVGGPAPPPPAAPKFDFSPYIKLNAITTNAAGVRQATIWDSTLNYIYEVTLLEEGATPDVRVRKQTLRQNRDPLVVERGKELLISQEGSPFDRTFKVMGIYEDGLVLTETVTESAAKDKDGKEPADPKKNPRPPFGGGRDRTPPKATKEQLAMSSVIGGVAMTKPTTTEHVYIWRMGQSMSALTPKTALPEKDGKELLKKVAGGETSPTATTPVAVPAPASGVEASPSPRLTDN